MSRATLVFAAGIALVVSPLFAGTPSQVPGQQPPPTPPKATAMVMGRVVDGSSGEAVSEVLVTLRPTAGARGAAAPAARGGLPVEQRVLTGSDGRFVFHSLPPGQVQIVVSRAGYSAGIPSSIPPGLGAAAVGMNMPAPPLSLTLAEGEIVNTLRPRLWKFAIVTGTVVDEAGEPAIGITVQPARRIMIAGRPRLVPGLGRGRTDDRGMYRLTGLPAGDYVIVVPQTQVTMPAGFMDAITKGVLSGDSTAGASQVLDLVSSGINPGEAMTSGLRVGPYMVSSTGGVVPILGADGRLQAYQTQFYPGAALPAQASVISLRSGEERSAVDFQLRPIPTARLSGSVTGPAGPLPNLGVRLIAATDGSAMEAEIDVANAMTDAQGRFTFLGLPPGQFIVRVLKQPRPTMPAEMLASNPQMAAMFGGPGSAQLLFGQSSVTMAGADVDDLTITLAEGAKVSGQIAFESASGRPAPAQFAVTLAMEPADGRSAGGLAGLLQPDRATKAEFTTRGYAPGKYFLTVSGAAGWTATAATLGGRDVLYAPIEIKDTDIAGLIITLGDAFPRVTGTVTAAAGTDLSETTVLFFPVEYRTWVENGMNPRRLLSGRADRNGAFTIPSVPSGEYFAVAFDRADDGDGQDPAFIERLSKVATRITVTSTAPAVTLTRVRVPGGR